VYGKLGTTTCAIIGTGAVLFATRVQTAVLSVVVLPIVVAHVGCDPPEVPAVVQRWIFPFESTMRLPTV
jgi:hypothetical protein